MKQDVISFAWKITGEKYGIFRGIANVELICENRMVIHILPEEQDLETIYQALKHPPNYLSLGRYEDLLDIQRVEIVELTMQRQVPVKRDCYIPVNYFQEEDWGGEAPINTTVYNLTKEYWHRQESGYFHQHSFCRQFL